MITPSTSRYITNRTTFVQNSPERVLFGMTFFSLPMSWVWKPFGTTDAASKCFVCRRCCIDTVIDIWMLCFIMVTNTDIPTWVYIYLIRHIFAHYIQVIYRHTYINFMINDVIISSLLVAQQKYSSFFGLCHGTHTSFMCESDEKHIGGWVEKGGARLAYCDWLL